MALIQCPECGKMISDKATFCIGCGCPIEEIVTNDEINRENLSAEELFELGFLYHEGENGHKIDVKKAFEYILLAAQKGLPSAQWKVANLYYAGDGIEANNEEMKKWIITAAKNGHDIAQYTLAEWYETGEFIEKNIQQALYWY